MKTWKFDWNGHHFAIEVNEDYGFAGLWRTSESILRVDGRQVDRQSSLWSWFLYLWHAPPTLATAVVGKDGQTCAIRVDFGSRCDCRVFADSNEVFKA
jgi:hypothetical protein